jgi:hypothetical protein
MNGVAILRSGCGWHSALVTPQNVQRQPHLPGRLRYPPPHPAPLAQRWIRNLPEQSGRFSVWWGFFPRQNPRKLLIKSNIAELRAYVALRHLLIKYCFIKNCLIFNRNRAEILKISPMALRDLRSVS